MNTLNGFWLSLSKPVQVLSLCCLVYSQNFSMPWAVSETVCGCTEKQRAETAYLKWESKGKKTFICLEIRVKVFYHR